MPAASIITGMLPVQVTQNIAETVGPGGASILSEELPHVLSATIGVWVRGGSRLEDGPERGLTHFLEHMFFKGTKRRTARQIAEELDAVGGHLDAATGREHTCFYARVLGQHLPLAVDVITDLLLNSLFRPEDIERERGVVLEEIRSVEDDPDDLVAEHLLEALFGDHPLARPILGKAEVIGTVERETLLAFRGRNYAAPRVTIAAAGAVGHAEVARLVEPLCTALAGGGPPPKVTAPRPLSRQRVTVKKHEQAHLALGAPALRFDHPDRYALMVLNNLLGGSMSSRLFQEVREKRGLAYSIYSSVETFLDTGLLFIQTSCEPAKFGETVQVIGDILAGLVRGGAEDSEVERSREQLKGNMFLGLEGTANRMTRLAASHMYHGRVIPLEELMESIDAVTPEAVRELAGRILGAGMFSSAVVGPGGEEQYRIPWIPGGAAQS
jgi:predicted Zn-dependent peptidase